MNPLLLRLRYGLDPVRWAREQVGFHDLDRWQIEALEAQERELIFLCCRQSGKSTIASLKAVHYCIFHNNALVILISPSQRQSSELFRKVRYDVIGKMKDPPRLLEDNLTSLRMANGSRIVALPSSEETIVGYSAADILIEDEASRVPDEIQTATQPFLATTNGQYIQLSTPKGKRGHFFRDWTAGRARKFTAIATEIPRISKEFLDRMKEKLGSRSFAQDFLCEFLEDMEGDLFKREWFQIVEDYPRGGKMVRRWDRASTEVEKNRKGEDENDPDYTVGVKMVEKEGRFWIIDVKRFRATPKGNEDIIKQTALLDGREVMIRMEEEGGSSGKDTIDHYTRNVLAGFDFAGVRSTGSKVDRANPLSACCEAGNLFLVRGDWDLNGFIDRLCAFPSDKVHDDEVDASSGAHYDLTLGKDSDPSRFLIVTSR